MKNKKRIAAALFLVLIVIIAALKYHMNQKARKEIDRTIERISAYADIGYENVGVQLLRSKIHIHDMTFMPVVFNEKIRIDEMVLFEQSCGNNDAQKINVEMNGIHIDFDQPYFHNIRSFIQQLGYPGLKADVRCSCVYNRNSRELFVESLVLAAENAGEIRFRIHLMNFSFPSREFDMATVFYFMTSLPSVSITEAEIRFKDDSFTERLCRICAGNKHQSPERFTNELIERINQEIQKEPSPSVQNAWKAIRDFLKNPDKISLQIAPKEPVSFRCIQRVTDPKKLLHVLNAKTGG